MVNLKELNEEMKNKGCTVAYMARILNLSRPTVYALLEGSKEFTFALATSFCNVLNLTEERKRAIFLF